MCGRFRGPRDVERLIKFYGVTQRPNFEFNPNVAPTETVPVVLADGKEKRLQLGSFGLERHGKDGKKQGIILNSRADSVRNGAFRSSYAQRRCIVPAEGFYEWRTEKGAKQPYFFHRRDGGLISFAGLYDYSEEDGEKLCRFTTPTHEPNPLIAPYHDRMPLAVENPDAWLAPPAGALDRVEATPPDAFEITRMNKAMNKPSEKDLASIEAD